MSEVEQEVIEEEKRRRLELKAIDNEVRDVAQTIDAKEALHAQLLMTQQQYEDMRQACVTLPPSITTDFWY